MGKPYFGFRGQALHRAIVGLAGMGFLLFGYDQGVMGGLLTLPSFVATFPEMDTVSDSVDTSHNSKTQGITIAIYEIGCMAGALITGLWFSDKYGRRKSIFIGAIIMSIGAIIQTSSYGLAQLIVGRIVTGVGNGAITATVPVWQSECAKAEHRGSLVMIEGALITGGVALSYWIDFAFYFLDPSPAAWRVPIAFQVIFAVAIICTVMSLPESPRWLIKKGRYEEAAEVFAALEDTNVDDDEVVLLIEEIRATLPLVESGSLKDLFKFGKEKNFHRTMLGMANQLQQQLGGINLVTYYAGTLFETSIGLSAFNSKILAAANGTEYFMASWIPVWCIDKIGRRKLMLFGSLGMSASMAILCGTVYAATPPDVGPKPGLGNSGAGICAAVFLFVFNTFFAIGWLGMTWLYPAEITPLRIRAPANGLSTAANWIANFAVVMITPVAFANIGWATYAIFAATNLLIAVTVWIFFPETARRSLEEIDLIFEHSNPRTPWDVVKMAHDLPHQASHDDDSEKGGKKLSAEAKYALQVRERKGFTAAEKARSQHFEHANPAPRRFDGPPASDP